MVTKLKLEGTIDLPQTSKIVIVKNSLQSEFFTIYEFIIL